MTARPNVVRDYSIGDTRIQVADDEYAEQSQEEIKNALREMMRKAKASLTADAVNSKYVV